MSQDGSFERKRDIKVIKIKIKVINVQIRGNNRLKNKIFRKTTKFLDWREGVKNPG